MRFNQAKCKVALGQGNPCYKYRLENKWIENSPVEQDLWILEDENLDMSRQCVLASQKLNCIVGCIQSSMASGSREGILLLYSTLVLYSPSGVLHPAQWSPAQERHGPATAGPEKGHEGDQRDFSYKECLR